MSSLSDKTGGPAFPEPVAVGPAGDVYRGMSGMSLRDYFAAAALTGFMANPDLRKSKFDNSWNAEVCARHAYTIADVMIAARLLDAAKSEVRG